MSALQPRYRVACAARTSVLRAAIFRAHSARYSRVHSKIVRRGVAWMEQSEIQESVFFPDSAALHLGYVAAIFRAHSARYGIQAQVHECTNLLWSDLEYAVFLSANAGL